MPFLYVNVLISRFIINFLSLLYDYIMVIVYLYRWWVAAFWFTVKNYFLITLYIKRTFWLKSRFLLPIIILLDGLAWSLDFMWAYFVYIFIKLPFLFTWISLLSFHTTWVLCVYFYRVYTNTELYPAPRTYDFIGRYVTPFSNYIQLKFLEYSISQSVRVSLWNIIVETFNLTFFFLPRYYRINDLMWQDGFLIDFLQKKVVDRWVRTFVIFSGYLFNERWLFDIVVRFYIDFIIWPTYKVSIYEFNSVTPTLTTTLTLLIVLVMLIFLNYLLIILL
jgi:hypothetical protein